MRNTIILTATLVFTLVLLIACAGKQGFMPPPQHPPEAELGKQRPICTDCHEARGEYVAFENFNHTAFFCRAAPKGRLPVFGALHDVPLRELLHRLPCQQKRAEAIDKESK